MYTKLSAIIIKIIRRIWNRTDSIDNFFLHNKKSKVVAFIFFLLFFGSIVFVFNQKTFLQWDDFKLAFIWPEEVSLNEDGGLTSPTERVASFKDILTSQHNHYYTWGGRTVVHIIAQFLLYVSPLTADILNTIVYLLYTILVYLHIKGKGKHDVLLFAGVNILVWLIQPVFGETILWLTGSANYLWGTTFILLFLLPYRLWDNQSPQKYIIFKSLGLFLLGIIAGWTNENAVAAAILMSVIFLAYYRTQKWKIPAWAICGCIGALIGYIIMITAPGNFVRANLRTSGIPMDLFHLSYRFLTSTQLLFEYLGVINLIGFMLFITVRKYTKDNKRQMFLTGLYLIASLAAIYVMLFSPSFPPRAWFGVITFNTIAFGILFKSLNLDLSFIRQVRIVSFLFGICFFGFTLYEGYRDVNNNYNIWIKREALILDQKQKGEPVTLQWTGSRTKFALGDPPFLPGILSLYYDIDVIME